jgi:hypothetical protein
MTLDTASIFVRPHRRHLGALGELMNNLPNGYTGMAVGYLDGIGYVLLGGERRFAAHQARQDQTVVVSVISTWDQWIAWLLMDLEFSVRYGSTPMGNLTAAYLDLKVRDVLRPGPRDHSARIIAEYTGLDYERVRGCRYVIERTTDPYHPNMQALALQLVDKIERGEVGPSAACDHLRALSKRLAQMEAGISSASVAQQRKILTTTAGYVSGMADGLNQLGPVSDEIGAEERAELVKALSQGRLALERVIRNLKEKK